MKKMERKKNVVCSEELKLPTSNGFIDVFDDERVEGLSESFWFGHFRVPLL